MKLFNFLKFSNKEFLYLVKLLVYLVFCFRNEYKKLEKDLKNNSDKDDDPLNI